MANPVLDASTLIWCWPLSPATELVNVIEPDRLLQVEALTLARREAAVLLTADQRLQQLPARVLH